MWRAALFKTLQHMIVIFHRETSLIQAENKNNFEICQLRTILRKRKVATFSFKKLQNFKQIFQRKHSGAPGPNCNPSVQNFKRSLVWSDSG